MTPTNPASPGSAAMRKWMLRIDSNASGAVRPGSRSVAIHGGTASTWLTRFDDFLQVYGWRTEGSCDIALPSWMEDPTPALGMIKSFLQKDTEHDFEKARDAAVEERDAAVDAVACISTLEHIGPSGCSRASAAGPVGKVLGIVSFGSERVEEQATLESFYAPN